MKHYDCVGQPIEAEDYVVIAGTFNGLTLCKVIDFSPKMVRVKKLHLKTKNKGVLVYGAAICKVDHKVALFHLLQKDHST